MFRNIALLTPFLRQRFFATYLRNYLVGFLVYLRYSFYGYSVPQQFRSQKTHSVWFSVPYWYTSFAVNPSTADGSRGNSVDSAVRIRCLLSTHWSVIPLVPQSTIFTTKSFSVFHILICGWDSSPKSVPPKILNYPSHPPEYAFGWVKFLIGRSVVKWVYFNVNSSTINKIEF